MTHELKGALPATASDSESAVHCAEANTPDPQARSRGRLVTNVREGVIGRRDLQQPQHSMVRQSLHSAAKTLQSL